MKQRNGAPAPKAEVRRKEVRSFAAGSDLEIRRATDGSMKLEGYAIRFNQPSQDLGGFIEYVDPKALNRTLRENPDVLLLRDHRQELLLARTTAGNLSLKVDEKGLRFAANLLDTTTASDACKDIKAGLLTGMSWGFLTRSDRWEQDASGNLTRVLLDIDVFEISATSFPAYQASNVDARSIAAKLNRRDLDDDACDPDSPDYDADECDDECRCDCRSCSEDRCEDCSAEDCADSTCAADGCEYAGKVETLRLRLKLHQHRRPIQSN